MISVTNKYRSVWLLTLLIMLTGGGMGVQIIHAQAPDFDCTTISDGMPQIECEALVAIHTSTDGLNWNYANGNASVTSGLPMQPLAHGLE